MPQRPASPILQDVYPILQDLRCYNQILYWNCLFIKVHEVKNKDRILLWFHSKNKKYQKIKTNANTKRWFNNNNNNNNNNNISNNNNNNNVIIMILMIIILSYPFFPRCTIQTISSMKGHHFLRHLDVF